ncbi:MAG: 1-deoxy-D-xylulose-5-phosphate synthase [Solobacterium sp.]|nr:1-deoxy-D-xylulose-5-phosphate synthase [Solobacterium sp.]
MDLTQIQNPAFLKDMSVSEMNELAAEIRSFLIENISRTGGHLASNLGVVELTIALHYVFDSPKDKIFFDVGHQCYVHKILTGRAGDFSRLRQFGGISGFQKRIESEHDVWEAGHSSTSLSAALGMAVARDLRGQNFEVVPVIGDGAVGGGMSFEALNQIGAEQRKMIIIFNDNNMSISNNVGGMSKSLARLRSAKSYNDLKTTMKHSLNRNEFGKVMYQGMKNIKDAVRDSVIESGIFGEFNLDYMGPVDGHNLRDLIRVMTVAKEHDGPVIIHAITQKGRGYSFCEKDRKGFWHGVGPFDVNTGRQLHETPEGYASWSALIADTLEEIAGKDQNVIALTPAMINGSALNHFFAKYPDRSFDCGIAEEHTATFAAGLAISGMRPFISVYSSFLQRAYDQINHDICRMDLPVVIGIDRAGLVGDDGDTHHGVFDITILKPLPNIIIGQPKDAREAVRMMNTAFAQKHPFAIRYPRGEVRVNPETSHELLKIGSWTVFNDRPDNQAAVLTYGPDVDRIVHKCEVNNLPVTVVNCRFFKPIDSECLERLAERNIPVIVYETDMKEGGLSTSVAEYYCDRKIRADVIRMGIGDHFVEHGSVSLLKRNEHLDMNSLFDVINTFLVRTI